MSIQDKNISDLKSMDEVREYLQYMKGRVSTGLYDILCFFLGMLENQGESTRISIQGKQVQIDSSIAELIDAINSAGIITYSCCSGLQEEHRGAKFPPSDGFIAIDESEHNLQIFNSLIEGLEIELNCGEQAYFNPAFIIKISGDDTEKKRKWEMIYARLSEMKI